MVCVVCLWYTVLSKPGGHGQKQKLRTRERQPRVGAGAGLGIHRAADCSPQQVQLSWWAMEMQGK